MVKKMKDVTIIEKVLRSMTTRYNYIVTAIEESHDLDEMTLDELQNSLQIHEQKVKKQEKEEQLLQAQMQALQVTTKPGARSFQTWKGKGAEKVNEGQKKLQFQDKEKVLKENQRLISSVSSVIDMDTTNLNARHDFIGK